MAENRVSHRAGVTQLVECDLAKVDVAGSNPVSRSKFCPPIAMIKRLFLTSSVALLAAFSAFAQYKLETISTPAPGLPAAYASLLSSQGYRVVGPKGAWAEVWFAKQIPTGAKPSDNAIVFPIAQGTFLGILRFPAQGADRRGQPIPAGVYTMRYSDFPVDGAHQGVAPQRDFALLTPVAADPDPNAKPGFEALVAMSKKASGSAHPAVFSLEQPSGSNFPAVSQEGDNDWVLSVKVGDLPIAIILVGTAGA